MTLRSQPSKSHSADPLRVVVVDDNVDGAQSLKALLELHGCTVAAAFDGVSGLEAVHSLRPDVVIADLNMPGLDGRELVARARTMAAGQDALFVCISAAPKSVEEAPCLAAGFDAYYEKPISLAALRAVIDSKNPLP